MDKLLQQLFGEDPETQPATPEPAATAAPTASAPTADPTREARHEARQQRKADHEARHRRKEFIDRYTTGEPTEGFTGDEAIAHLREMRDEMSPAEFRQAMKQTLENLPPDQRDEAIAMMQRHKQATGAAAPNSSSAQATPQSGVIGQTVTSSDAAFGTMLNSLMGSGAGGADFSGIVDDLRQGGLKSPASKTGTAPTEADFQALLNSPLARAVLGGIAAYGLQNMQADGDDHDTPGGARPARS
jgi:hypothetical protein